jgi:hypothetical protein
VCAVRYAPVLLLAACGAEVAPDPAPARPAKTRLRVHAGRKIRFPDVDHRPPPENDIERAFREVDQSPSHDLR